MFNVNAANKIVNIRPEPAVAAPGESITLSALVTDEMDAPASGVTVTWMKVSDHSTTTSDTDSSGIATLKVESDYQGVVAYIAYLGSDQSTAKAAEACFYNSALQPVFVPNGMDGELDKYDVEEGVQVIIRHYNGAAANDVLTFWWDNIKSYTKVINNPATDFPVTLDITNDFPPACLANDDYQLFYQYRDQSGNQNVSLPWTVSVTGGSLPPSLSAPEFPEGSDGWINIAEASDGTPIKIAYKGMAANDTLNVTWQLYNETHVTVLTDTLTYTVTEADATAKSCQVMVPATDIPAVQRGSAQAWYQMKPADGSGVQSSVVAEVGVDTVA